MRPARAGAASPSRPSICRARCTRPRARPAGSGLIRCSFGAKNSSFAATTAAAETLGGQIDEIDEMHGVIAVRPDAGAGDLDSSIPHAFAAQKRLSNDTAKAPAGVGRQLVPLLKRARIDDELRVRIPDDEIGVASRLRSPLCDRSDRRAPPAPALIQRARAAPAARTYAKPPAGGDATPVHIAASDSSSEAMPPQARDEVAGTLQGRRRRRMVGRDEIQHASLESLPQRFAMVRLANRRRALELGGAVGNLFGGERQVVRARFGRDRHAAPPARASISSTALAGRHVHDVRAARRTPRRAEPSDRSPRPPLPAAASRDSAEYVGRGLRRWTQATA